MGKRSAPAPMPDIAGIQAAQAAQAQAAMQAQVAREQLEWAKEQYAQNKQQIQPVIDAMVTGMNAQNAFTQQQQGFYTENYQPLERDFVQQARDWSTPQRQELMAGEAAADVAQQYEGARQAAAQNLRDYGVDPTSGRYAATDFASRVSQAATAAGAQNLARRNTEAMGLQLQQAAINTGRGYAGNINQGYSGAAGTGGNIMGGVNQSGSVGAQMMGVANSAFGNANQAMSNWGNIANNNYNNYMQGYQFANTPQSSGIGSALGLIGGMAMRRFGFEEGGAVPTEASPSMGAAVDDIPARLNAGEFIMPREAVSWFGEKAMHDMIMKAQKERAQVEQQSGAVPDVMPAQPEAPRLISGPKPAAALPAR